jgi:hypothetical protein
MGIMKPMRTGQREVVLRPDKVTKETPKEETQLKYKMTKGYKIIWKPKRILRKPRLIRKPKDLSSETKDSSETKKSRQETKTCPLQVTAALLLYISHRPSYHVSSWICL